jgi:hypothetical protein
MSAMQVRVGVLEREKAELDDRVGALETQLASTDKLAAQDFATKVRPWQSNCRVCKHLLPTHSIHGQSGEHHVALEVLIIQTYVSPILYRLPPPSKAILCPWSAEKHTANSVCGN